MSDFYLLRTPAKSHSFLNQVLEAYDSKSLINFVMENEDLKLAIATSSPSLFDAIRRVNVADKKGDKRSIWRIEFSIYKYLSRMATRSTPFGYMSGVSVGEISDSSADNVSIRKDAKNHKISLDFMILKKIVKFIEDSPEYSDHLIYHRNPSIYIFEDSYRYNERYEDGRNYKYRQSEFAINPYIELILSQASEGASKTAMTTALIDFDKSLLLQDISEYLNHLVDNDVLQSNLLNQVVGSSLLDKIVTNLCEINSQTELAKELIFISNLLKNECFSLETLDSVKACLNNIGITITDEENVIHVEQWTNMLSNSISRLTVENFLGNLDRLAVLDRSRPNPKLQRFKDDFLKTYGSRAVPLSEVFDGNFGIGYGHVGIENEFYIDAIPTLKNRKEVIPDLSIKLKLELLGRSQLNSNKTVEIFDDDLVEHGLDHKSNSSKYVSLFGQIVYEKQTPFLCLNSYGGVSGLNLITRFAVGNPDLTQKLVSIVEEENNDSENIDFAEVNFSPMNKIVNVIQRPALRTWQINIGGAAVKGKGDLSPRDVLVTVRKDEVKLISKNTGREVVPRITSAHNHNTNSFPIYKFLGDLQYQKISHGLFWRWGEFQSIRFLPRVIYKNIILSPATWNLYIEDLPFTGSLKSNREIRNNIQSAKDELLLYMEKLSIPHIVSVKDNDNGYLLNLKSDLCQEILVFELFRYRKIQVTENLSFENTSNLVKDITGEAYSHEVVFPIRREKGYKFSGLLMQDVVHSFTEEFDVSEKQHINLRKGWLYFKLYCNNYFSNEVLFALSDFSDIEDSFVTKKWFFIRYNDHEGDHLRLRFLKSNSDIENMQLLTRLLEFFSRLLKRKIILDYKTDTYSREIERYGLQNIELCEEIFCVETKSVINLLKSCSAIDANVLFTACLYVKIYLSNSGMSEESKIEFVQNGESAFIKEFGVEKSILKILKDMNRNYRKDLLLFMESPPQVIFDELQQSKDQLEITLRSKSTFDHRSMIHMTINRFFKSNQRKYELLVYSLLYKYFLSQKYIKNGTV